MLEENQALFLNELVKAFHNSVPFQNVTLLCEPEADRHVPTWEESKKSVMRGYGGLCYAQCVYMKFLLESLEYDVYFASRVVSSVPLTTISRPLFKICCFLEASILLILVRFQLLRQSLLISKLSLQSTTTLSWSTSFSEKVAVFFACIARENITLPQSWVGSASLMAGGC